MKEKGQELSQFVGALIQDKQGRILASQRSLNSKMYPGQWQIPGGKVEKGEDCLKALKREVKEETNLEIISVDPPLKLLYNSNVLVYLAKAKGKPKIMEPEKNAKWVYLEPNNLAKKNIIPALKELFERNENFFLNLPKQKTIWIATNNPNKKQELNEIFSSLGINIKTLLDLKEKVNIMETGKSFQENALIKARALAKIVGEPCLGDDSGFCLATFKNWPGIYSARAKGNLTHKEFNHLILSAMKEKKNRKCSFISALAYFEPQNKMEKIFLSSVKGQVSSRIIGKNGFGFDPIFYFPPLKKTFAQLTIQEKNQISHRAQCLKKFLRWWKKKINSLP
jgi:XTP/dITP diphosphohydrolase